MGLKAKIIIFGLIFGFFFLPLFSVNQAQAVFGIDALVAEGFKAATELAKKQALKLITRDIVNWINGNGEPKFITDFDGFLREAGNRAAGEFAQDLGLGDLCEPFSFQLKIALTLPQVPTFDDTVTCTLDSIVSNIENFYDDFRAGGFVAFNASWQPQNNFYGSFLIGLEEKNRRIANAKSTNLLEAITGGGYLGNKNCEKVGNREFCRVTTPGQAVGEALAKVVGSDIDYIVNSQELAAYVAVVADALINRLIREAGEGLLGLEAPPVPPIEARNPCRGFNGEELRRCQAVFRARTGAVLTDLNNSIGEIDGTLLPRLRGELALEEAIDRQVELVNSLFILNACRQANRLLPGPEGEELARGQETLEELVTDFFRSKRVSAPLDGVRYSIQGELPDEAVAILSTFFDVTKIVSPAAATRLTDLRNSFGSLEGVLITPNRDREVLIGPGDLTNVDLTAYDLASVAYLIDATAAANFEAAAELEAAAVIGRAKNRLPAVESALNSCLHGS